MKSTRASSPLRKSSRILAGSIAALVTAGFLAAPAPARAVGLWNGNADGLWSGLNWDVAPAALDPLVFSDLNLTGALVTATTNNAFLTNVAGITFNGVSYSIGGSAFTLEGVVNTTGAATISANVTLGAGGGTLVTNAASSLSFTGTFDAGSQALDASGAGNVTFANAISNGTNLAKSGAGTLTLAGTNGFSDLITSGGIITGGVITLNSGATALTSNAN
ncbi:MAG: hypothetical protein NTX04_00535, partial [Verrucomicrobia bacterium]|nr:hypothetical protein [Verrucomicrobiota bacterium]